MPVENHGLVFPRANVQFEAPEGPIEVVADDGTNHTALVEASDVSAPGEDSAESPVTVDHSEIHEAKSLDNFEVPGPEKVTVEGYTDSEPPAAEAEPEQPPGEPPAEQSALAYDLITLDHASGPDEAPAEQSADAPAEQPAGEDPAGESDPPVVEEEPPGRHEAPESKVVEDAQAKVVEPPAPPAGQGTPGVEVK